MNPKEMIHQYLLGNLDEEGVEKLNRLLANDPELRVDFAQAANVDAALRDTSVERSIEAVSANVPPAQSHQPNGRFRFWLIAACTAVAASMLIAIGLWMRQPQAIATIVSSEDAAWESRLPTSPGAELSPGVLNLRTGIATIEFHSGAELVVEAPAQIELVSDMRAKLNAGAAVMDVPHSAKGFVLETPEGFAIDFGTRFAVNVDQVREASDFELIEGEIEVHHPKSGTSLRLNEVGAAALVSVDSMELIEDRLLDETQEWPVENGARIIRVATEGRCGSAIRNEKRRGKAILPEYLYAKHTGGKWEMRSFFQFDLTAVPRDRIDAATLRLNQVLSYRGSASLLPKINRFAVYGLTNSEKDNWTIETTWDESPGPEDGVLLGTFEIPRSQQRGKIEVSTPELRDFVSDHGDKPVTLILVRETNRTPGIGSSMTHMFASDRHPEAVGPLLELTVSE